MSRLAPCPSSPNCVSSLADPSDEVHYVTPLPLASVDQLVAAVERLPRTEVVERREAGLHAVCTTALMRFKDDLELEIADDCVHVRSASRLGYGDLGVNRRRVERLRTILEST